MWPLTLVLCVLALVSDVSTATAQPPAEAQPASSIPSAAAPTQGAAQPARLPPANAGPIFRTLQLVFEPVNESLIEPQTYLYYIQSVAQVSRPSDGVWLPYTEDTEKALVEDFKRLWATSFLDNLWIEVNDAPYGNGVVGKHVIFHLEERPRIKIVDYTGTGKVDRTKVDEKMREKGISLRLDSFLDQSQIRRTSGLLREMMAEKGYEFAEVTTSTEELPGGPKLVKVVFNVDQGPKVKIRDVEFVGNEAIGDGTLKRRMKNTKEHWFLSWITSRGTYQEAKFEEDAEKVVEHYRNKGYVEARVGQPEIKTLADSADKETRWIQLRIPVTEGPRYRVGEVAFDGNTVVKSEFLRPLYKQKTGDWYSEKRVRDFFIKAREVYGAGGYFEMTGLPDLKPQQAAEGPLAGSAVPNVDVTLRLQEGEQYFVNRITFTGNTTTRDNVIRRELRLVEGGVFNTESLKYSVRRLNQLGYFKNLEEQGPPGSNGIDVQKTPNSKNEVDVTLKLEEQNRNQLTFGAGVSQFEGFFGQLSFQTSNFLGRGESLTLSLQAGSRAENYQLAFTEPFLFDRNITGGVDIFRRSIQYINQFTQKSTGGNVLFGFPVADFSRLFLTYSYEQVRVTDLNQFYFDPVIQAQNPFLRDSLLIGAGGVRTISKVVPSFVFNTVDNPIFPNTGRRVTMSMDLAGLGGNTSFVKPKFEAVAFMRHTSRTSVGLRGQVEYVRTYGSTDYLPLFERLFQGGEYSIRGFDVRSIGPRDPATQLVLGGNKSLLFNAEYMVQIAGPVRLIFFYDAGQVRNQGEGFGRWEDVTRVSSTGASLIDPFAQSGLRDPNAPAPQVVTIGRASAFKTSTGAEVRFFMPVLNVPFRLIFAMNPQRGNVLDNNLDPAKRFTFRFAVGSTF
ncbi:MAG: outer membrane protein assembly factor BamA [Acidobacteria bacterium]|nr:outer membrane protein assembly factor BamA [Acidobacteriota bacterium]